MLSCSNGYVCTYKGRGGFDMTATVEYHGNIIRTILSADDPDGLLFSGASTNDAPAMLFDVPSDFRRTSDPLMLKMFFFEDTDDPIEECPAENQVTVSTRNGTVSYQRDNSTFYVSVSSQTHNTFMGMEFDYVSQAPVGHTNAFEIPAGTQIVWVSREEMVDVLLTQELPTSLETRMEAQLRKASLAKGMDYALAKKGSRRRRRRRAPTKCTGGEIGMMAGGAAATVGGFAVCFFTAGIGCLVGGASLVKVGTVPVVNGACNCWAGEDSGNDAGQVGCALR